MSKILIVEDDPMLVEIYEKKLGEAGFEVKIITNGTTAVEEALAFRPEIILLDVVLPDMDGYEILEAMRKEDDLQNTPIYIFSNLAAKEDMERATSLGAAGFLTKSSFTPSQLAAEIKKILGKEITAPAAPAPAPEAKPDAAPAPEIEVKDPNGHKVLLIEDEDIFITMFGDKLKQEGFEVVSAKNGAWGVKEAERGGFSCVLLDMMMPAMNGLDAIKELRSSENTKNTPIIVLSNSALDSEMKEAMDLGASAYHVKTKITPGEVAEEVKELIKNKSGAES